MVAERARKTEKTAGPDPAKELRRRLGRWLKKHREDQGLTQADLADALGLRYYSFVSQVENGLGRIPQDLYVRWSDAIGISHEDFGWTMLAHLEPGLYRMLSKKPPPDPGAPVT